MKHCMIKGASKAATRFQMVGKEEDTGTVVQEWIAVRHTDGMETIVCNRLRGGEHGQTKVRHAGQENIETKHSCKRVIHTTSSTPMFCVSACVRIVCSVHAPCDVMASPFLSLPRGGLDKFGKDVMQTLSGASSAGTSSLHTASQCSFSGIKMKSSAAVVLCIFVLFAMVHDAKGVL